METQHLLGKISSAKPFIILNIVIKVVLMALFWVAVVLCLFKALRRRRQQQVNNGQLQNVLRCMVILYMLMQNQKRQLGQQLEANGQILPVARAIPAQMAQGEMTMGHRQMIQQVIAKGAPAYNQGRVRECAGM
jgi:hypothetical protein